MTDTKTLTKADPIQFTGSEHWYRHAMVRDVLYTDGVKYVAETVRARWAASRPSGSPLERTFPLSLIFPATGSIMSMVAVRPEASCSI